ncbi:MAG TPA: SGNH/GDSL hydrolase family protein [Verrucomicrobiae bacterium]|nr:SGNH/GDSL hydrolase family protein [Verrucomicrobiae bacterium]
MRTKLVLLLSFVHFALITVPLLESKPGDAYFDKYQPLKVPETAKLILKTGDRLAICGDSITEQRMYSRLIEDYLTMCAPQLQVTVRQYGWSGEKVPGFLPRMTNDCLRFHPTIATTAYGMNDFEYRPYEDRIGQTYETNSLKMIETFQANGVRVILGAPSDVSKMPFWVKSANGTVDDLNLSLCRLRNIDIQLAKKEKLAFADVFWPMLVANFEGRQRYGTNYGIPGNDGVHPHWAGHTLMAYAFLKAMGLDGDIGTFTVDLKKNKIKVSKGHQIVSVKPGEYEIESRRYPFCPCAPEGLVAASYPVCGQDGLDSDNSIQSGMTWVSFNRELNRLTLVVKNGSASNYLVTWGENNKTFSAEQLAKGINLAAEFPANPFSAAFAKVDAAVAAKQAYETKEMKELFRQTGDQHPDMAQITAHTDRIVGEAEKEHATLAAAAQTAFVPVTHTIKITTQ